MIRPKTATFVLAGFAYGALLYGGPISVAHLLYNHLAIVQDSLLLWLSLSLLFGISGLVIFGTVFGLWRAAAGRANRSRDGSATLLAWSSSLYNVGFFLPFVLYGTTYDQVPLGELSSAAGMIAYLVVLGLLVTAAAVALSILVSRLLLAQRQRLWRFACLAGAALFAVHVLGPLVFKRTASADRPAAMTAVRPLRAAERAAQKVFVICLDGADFRVIEPLMAAGELPNFQDFVDNGSWARLKTIPRTNSPEIWASIFTGHRSSTHGVRDFYRIIVPGMRGSGFFPVHRTFVMESASFAERFGLARRQIVNRFSLSQPPLWEIIDDLGATVGVVDGYFFSVPAPKLARQESWFFSYELGSVAGRGGLERLDAARIGSMVQPVSAFQYFAPHVDEHDFDWQAATLLSILETSPQPDYGQLYAHEPDIVQHRRWKWYQPDLFLGVREGEVEERHDAIPARYRSFDVFLGRLQRVLDPDTTIIISSDHGHSPTLAHAQFYSQHRHGPPGILLMKGPSIRRGYEIESAHVLDIMPTVLHLLGFPIARDLAGRVVLEALQGPVGERSSLRTIDSYTVFAKAVEVRPIDEALNREEIEKLRALGYIP